LLPFGKSKIRGFKTPKEWGNGAPCCYDYAVIELEDEIGTKTFSSLRNKPLGYWGSTSYGEHTKVESVDAAKLRKKTIHLSGYAGDKCGYMTILPHTPGARCYANQVVPGPAELKRCMDNKLLGSAQYGTKGKVIDPGRGGLEQLLLYDADTCGAQSGSPVWMQSGRYRYLVGVHTGTFDLSSGTCANTQPGNIVDANRATRLTDQVLKNIRSWT
jgi:V8-like Glu-specific endopeptidase